MPASRFGDYARQNPDAIALVDPRGRAHSRAELFSRCNRLARALVAQGLQAGDTLAVIAPNCVEYLQLYMAATHIGLYVVPINWHLSPTEITHVLRDSAATVVVVHERMAALARALFPMDSFSNLRRFSIGSLPDFTALQEIMAGCSDEPLPQTVLGRVLMYTSATTGVPKGISLPLADAAAALERTIAFHTAIGIHPEDANAHLCASMLYHAAPLEAAAVALHMGHKVVLTERSHPEQLLSLIDSQRVTTGFMVPAMFVRLLKLDSATRARYATDSLRFVVHGAAPCPTETKRQMIEWWGPVIWETYGAAEGAGTISSSNDWLRYPGTVGAPIPGSRLKILDEHGTELPTGEIGTVYLTRYTGDRFAYRGDPAKTQAAHRGDFFTVGDIGYLNEAGYLFLCDRSADVIISGGMNIYSAAIEQILVQHPSVADCAVFGVPDELMGEAVRAVVQPLPNLASGAELAEDITRFLARRLPASQLPRRIEFMSELPRDPNGKMLKRRLRDPHWSHGLI